MGLPGLQRQNVVGGNLEKQSKGRERRHGSCPVFQKEVYLKGITDAANAIRTFKMPEGEKHDALKNPIFKTNQ